MRFREVAMAVTRTSTVPNPGAVPVSVSIGEFLHFTIDAAGAVPIFSLASNVKGVLHEAADFPGHPMARYEWDHLRNPSDIQQLELLNLGLAFVSCPDYRYRVEVRSKTAAAVVVLDVSYKGLPTDVASESFTVVIR
jgi:hypothetical protein